MMPKVFKLIFEDELEDLKPEENEISSKISSVNNVKLKTFTDSFEEKHTIYFKTITDIYPTLLAMIEVAASIRLRAPFPERFAECRIVVNRDFNVTGMGSIKVVFSRLLCKHEELPKDLKEQALVCPSTDTLIEHKIVEILLPRFIIADDDVHPFNLSLTYGLDYDSAFYFITAYLKGLRWNEILNLIESPLKRFNLKVRYLDNFPYQDAATHAPTYDHPLNWNISIPWFKKAGKQYANPEAFRALAEHPLFQEQLFFTLLTELLFIDHTIRQDDLDTYFSDLKFNYQTLDPDKKKTLETTHPDLFNSETNDMLFSEWMLKIFKKIDNRLLKASVLYPGCPKNTRDIKIMALSQYLLNHPSAYKKIHAKICEMNVFRQIEFQAVYSLTTLEKRYHEIFRDSHGLVLTHLLHTYQMLLSDLQKWTENSQVKLLNASDLFNENSFELSNSYEALKTLYEAFKKALSKYYETPFIALSRECNEQFCFEIQKISEKGMEITSEFSEESNWQKPFSDLFSDLAMMTKGLKFETHLGNADDAFMAMNPIYERIHLNDHTDPLIVSEVVESIFLWVDKNPLSSLKKCLLGIDVSFEKDALAYLEKDENGTTSEKLAWVFCEAAIKAPHFNNLFLRAILEMMWEEAPLSFYPSRFYVQSALEYGHFNDALYLPNVLDYAKNHPSLFHPHVPHREERFYRNFFSWILTRPQDFLEEKVSHAFNNYLNQYSGMKGWWSGPQRKPGIEKRSAEFKEGKLSNDAFISMLFSEGGVDSSFNIFLFKALWESIRDNQRDVTFLSQNYPRIFSTESFEPFLQGLKAAIEARSKEPVSSSISFRLNFSYHDEYSS